MASVITRAVQFSHTCPLAAQDQLNGVLIATILSGGVDTGEHEGTLSDTGTRLNPRTSEGECSADLCVVWVWFSSSRNKFVQLLIRSLNNRGRFI